MKIREGFVSNSSTSSYIFRIKNKSDKPIPLEDFLDEHFRLLKKVICESMYTTFNTLDEMKEEIGFYIEPDMIPPNKTMNLRIDTRDNRGAQLYEIDAVFGFETKNVEVELVNFEEG